MHLSPDRQRWAIPEGEKKKAGQVSGLNYGERERERKVRKRQKIMGRKSSK